MSMAEKRRVPKLGSVEWLVLQAGLPERLVNDPALARYARRTRRWRLGIVLGVFGGSYAWAVLATVVELPKPNAVVVLVAWFAARLLPELCWSHRASSSTRLAVVEDRSPLRYVTPTARRWLTAAVALAAGCVGWSLVLGPAPGRDDLVGILVSVLVATCGALAVWRVARRSYAAGTADDVVVDDAIRVFGTTAVVSGWSASAVPPPVLADPVPRAGQLGQLAVAHLRRLRRDPGLLGVGADASVRPPVARRRRRVIIAIDPVSAVPPFEQLREQLATMIGAGTLRPGHRLPSVRQLAGDLGLANGTVARAYRELEQAGLVSTHGRHGTTVDPTTTLSAETRRVRLDEAATTFVRVVRQLGVPQADVAGACREPACRPVARLTDAVEDGTDRPSGAWTARAGGRRSGGLWSRFAPGGCAKRDQ